MEASRDTALGNETAQYAPAEHRVITLPIVVSEHGDVMFFKSVEHAESALEAIDVAKNEYEAFDAEGRVLTLSVKTEQRSALMGFLTTEVERVAISCEHEQPQAEEVLRAVLSDFLVTLGVPSERLESESLESLVRQALERTGFAK